MKHHWLADMPWWFRWIILPASALMTIAAELASCSGRT